LKPNSTPRLDGLVSRSTLFDVARSGLFEGLPSSASRAS
jgi:hypothetical protein